MNIDNKNSNNMSPNIATSSVQQKQNNLQRKQVDFDYDEVRKLYFKELECMVKIKTPHLVMSRNRAALYNKILQVKSAFTSYQKMYEVITVDGEDWLIIKRLRPTNPIIRVLSIEDCFDIIVKAHIETGHGDLKAVTTVTKLKYCYPKFCITTVLNCCNVCNEPRSLVKDDKSVWYLSLVQMKRAINPFKYLLIYTEKNSKYTILRPLISKSINEVTLELLKIFLVFGAPLSVHTTGVQIYLINSIADRLAARIPWFKFRMQPLGRYLYLHKKYIYSIIDSLDSWMNETGCDKWELGCHIVQWKINTTRKFISSYNRLSDWTIGIPYEIFFGREANVFNYVSSNEVPDNLNNTKWDQNETAEDKEDSCLSHYRNLEETRDIKTSEKSILDTDKVYSTCFVCNMTLLVQYKCRSCHKPTHSNCGTIKRNPWQKGFYTVECNLCQTQVESVNFYKKKN